MSGKNNFYIQSDNTFETAALASIVTITSELYFVDVW